MSEFWLSGPVERVPPLLLPAYARGAQALITRVQQAMDAALAEVRVTPADTVTLPRHVGRQQLPTTTLGAIAHAAEHALRHAGQIATLRKVLA